MRMTDMQENVLYVRMLGGFSVQWNGKLIAGGSKANGSQFAYLLQIMIHNRDRGVSRDKLEELLFEDRDMSNIHHALQSVIYNAKKKLEQAGLPPVNYIEQKKGVFFWTGEIPLVEDAADFEELCRKAESAEDENERIALYLDACHWYSGEFLPMWPPSSGRRTRRAATARCSATVWRRPRSCCACIRISSRWKSWAHTPPRSIPWPTGSP